MDREKLRKLQEICKELRVDIVEMLAKAGSGHPGGSLSEVELFTLLYFGGFLRHDPKNPNWAERDLLVLSKGHGAPALYAALAKAGFFPREDLWKLRHINSPLQGHPDRLRTPGVEASTGSLGQGLSIAQGMAIAAKMDHSGRRVYCVMGDGEIQEGQVWEAAMSAPKFALNNLTAILDYNKIQLDGPTNDIMDIEPIFNKFIAFRWEVFEVDGHDLEKLEEVMHLCRKVKDRPQLIVAHTVKGKGVSFMENIVDWHGKAPKDEEAQKAIAEILQK